MNYLLPDRLERLAREYALGTLAGSARWRFERVLPGVYRLRAAPISPYDEYLLAWVWTNYRGAISHDGLTAGVERIRSLKEELAKLEADGAAGDKEAEQAASSKPSP